MLNYPFQNTNVKVMTAFGVKNYSKTIDNECQKL
jgi:hypothetical protein